MSNFESSLEILCEQFKGLSDEQIKDIIKFIAGKLVDEIRKG